MPKLKKKSNATFRLIFNHCVHRILETNDHFLGKFIFHKKVCSQSRLSIPLRVELKGSENGLKSLKNSVANLQTQFCSLLDFARFLQFSFLRFCNFTPCTFRTSLMIAAAASVLFKVVKKFVKVKVVRRSRLESY